MLKHVCNICGKDFNLWDEQEDFSIRKIAGYGSKFDGQKIDLDICCNCFEQSIIPLCKIVPVTEVNA